MIRFLRWGWGPVLVGLLLVACRAGGDGGGKVDSNLAPLPQATPPPQSLLVPGEAAEGTLETGETDRWVFAAVGGEGGTPHLATVEVWFRPSTSSGPEAALRATLFGPEGVRLAQQEGTVTLPPYIVEQELPQTGSYLLVLEALSGTPGRYTLLVTLSEERYLTRPEVYGGAPPIQWPLEELPTGSSGFLWPSPRSAISGWYFHDPSNPRHAGLDIAAALHDPIFATAAGVVSFADVSGGYGNLVVIDHADGWQSWYAHLSAFSVVVGQQVEQGEVIGAAGSTGRSSGPHLHFELRHNGVPVDPLVYLRPITGG